MRQVQWADGRAGYPGLSEQDETEALELPRYVAPRPPSYTQIVQNRPAPQDNITTSDSAALNDSERQAGSPKKRYKGWPWANTISRFSILVACAGAFLMFTLIVLAFLSARENKKDNARTGHSNGDVISSW